jgi:hypothetical protein
MNVEGDCAENIAAVMVSLLDIRLCFGYLKSFKGINVIKVN